MAIGRIVCGDIVIAMDLFSVKSTAMKPGEVWELPADASPEEVKRAVYEAMSGNKWSESTDRMEKVLEMEDE